MEFKTNVPNIKEQRVCSDDEQFKIGDRVRVLMKGKSEYIGKIISIFCEGFYVRTDFENKQIFVSEVEKMRIATPTENLNDFPFFDDEEKDFWRKHILCKEGIRERTESEKVDW